MRQRVPGAQLRRTAAAGLVGALVALSATACTGGSEGDARASESTASESTPTAPTGSTTAPESPEETAGVSPEAADPAHAVPPPGPRTGPLASADILVAADTTIDQAMIERIRKVDGVTGVVPISRAQPSVQGRLLNVVAADLAAYRAFTPLHIADNPEVWDRAAGGEIVLAPGVKETVGFDEHGFLALGEGEHAPKLHVGITDAPQITGAVDAVVNEKWGETLGFPRHNALLISTGIAAPDRVVTPIKRIVGGGVSIQRLDVVAQLGLDPQAVQVPVLVGAVADAVGEYSYTVADGRVIPSAEWVRSHITTETVPILGSITCNKHIFPQLKEALAEIVERGLADKIYPDQYAGCYYPRFIAGSQTLSNHAFGLAFDINVPGNQRGSVGEIDRTVVSIFEKWGFAWGGRWKWTDPMHFELARIVEPS